MIYDDGTEYVPVLSSEDQEVELLDIPKTYEFYEKDRKKYGWNDARAKKHEELLEILEGVWKDMQ